MWCWAPGLRLGAWWCLLLQVDPELVDSHYLRPVDQIIRTTDIPERLQLLGKSVFEVSVLTAMVVLMSSWACSAAQLVMQYSGVCAMCYGLSGLIVPQVMGLQEKICVLALSICCWSPCALNSTESMLHFLMLSSALA